ncbi:MAG: aminotransferase class I/II-fold pyridoxal phosphate-dependent enzyme, partial [Anaerolineales bacterium]|nr:aminotransferase class I/II-fold pyridoxal phosphate-dependent enzyme [Anaerolineales bacterium]
YLEANYLYLRDFLERELPQIRLTPAEGLYLAWLDCRPLGLSDAVLQQLLTDNARVVLEPGTHYGPEGSGFVRLNLACPRALLAQALARIRRALA